jgi:hypothetical protein
VAKFHISEYNAIHRINVGDDPAVGDGEAQVVKEPSITTQAFAFAASTQSNAFNDQTRVIRITNATAAICYWKVGSNPTATADSAPLGANATVEYFGVNPGDKIAVYDGTT